MYDKAGENRAAAAAAAVARKKWREAQAAVAHGPMEWIRTRDRLPAHHAYVLTCPDPSVEYNPPVQILVFIQPSVLDRKTLKNLDTFGDIEGRDFTEADFAGIDGAFWNTDGCVSVASDDDFPVYWMPLPQTPWDR